MATYPSSIASSTSDRASATAARLVLATMPATRTTTRLTRMLVACGLVFGPLFYIVAIVQMVIRRGFDLRRHAISLLSLGDLGWIQITNFLVTGILVILCAIGVRRLLRDDTVGTWGPALIGVSGLATAAAAIVHPDPGLGFPPGAPTGMPTTMSGHAMLHMLAFCVAFLSLIVACFVVRRRFTAQGLHGWSLYCLATGIIAPVFIILGMSNRNWVGVFMAIGVALVFGWVAALAAHLLTESVRDAALRPKDVRR